MTTGLQSWTVRIADLIIHLECITSTTYLDLMSFATYIRLKQVVATYRKCLLRFLSSELFKKSNILDHFLKADLVHKMPWTHAQGSREWRLDWPAERLRESRLRQPNDADLFSRNESINHLSCIVWFISEISKAPPTHHNDISKHELKDKEKHPTIRRKYTELEEKKENEVNAFLSYVHLLLQISHSSRSASSSKITLPKRKRDANRASPNVAGEQIESN